MPAGRKKIEFTEEQLRQMEVLAAMGATNESIAEFMHCSSDTLVRNFAEPIKKGKNRMKNNLRLVQYRAAMNGSIAMMIWLGKVLLGQSEYRGYDNSVPTDGYVFVDPGEKKNEPT